MGVREWFAGQATRHVHVLVVEAPASWQVRAAVERQVLEHGWVLAASPADADVLAVCGPTGPGFAAAVEHVWQQMPGPRARIDVEGTGRVRDALVQAAARLVDNEWQYGDVTNRVDAPALLAEHDQAEEHHGGHDQHAGMDHSQHGGHGGHGGMDMAPDGIPLAQGGEDRDGLEMDVLHVRLGPVLPHWPAGLVLRCSLQGDVIVRAEVELLDHATHEPVTAVSTVAARGCDNVAALLALAGWDDAAALARRIRDDLLSTAADNPSSAVANLRLLHRKVARSRVLRWALRGVGPVHDRDLEEHDLPESARGDTYDRLLRLVERARRVLEGDTSMDRHEPSAADTAVHPKAIPPRAIPPLVTGLDLATARLVVASLDLDLLRAGRKVADA